MLPAPFTCPNCSREPARQEPTPADPLPAAVGIVTYLNEHQSWSKRDIKTLGGYMIGLCDTETPSAKKPSLHETMLNHFAALLNMDSTALLASWQLDRSFSRTIQGETNSIENLVSKLSREQIKVISRTILGNTTTNIVFLDNKDEEKAEIGYQVINKICQAKGSGFTIRQFLDGLTDSHHQV